MTTPGFAPAPLVPLVVPTVELIEGPVLAPLMIPLFLPEDDIPMFEVRPSWEDVFDWAKKGYDKVFYGGTRIHEFITPEDLETAMDGVAGEMIKALSGFINQSFTFTTNLGNILALQAQVDNDIRIQEQARVDSRLAKIEQTNDAILQLAIPNLQAQIQQQWTNTVNGIKYVAMAERQYAIDNYVHPLTESIFKVHDKLDAQIKGVEVRIPEIVRTIIPTLGLATAPALNAVRATAMDTAQWVKECGVAMCDVAGPKTDLGKALKAFKFSEWAALLAMLGLATRDDIEDWVLSLANISSGIVGDLANFLQDGHGTLGTALAKAAL